MTAIIVANAILGIERLANDDIIVDFVG
jgi:hypothetical protein